MSDESKELQVARALIARGVPVFACPPGDGPKGFRLPVAWQKFEPDEKRLKVWRDGYALAAVMGHAYDVIDWDPRNSPGELPFAMPEVYGVGVTPGRGLHYWIKTVGARKGVIAQGWDLQSGTEDGGRGFVFLPGTPGYAWVEEPRPVREGDTSGAVVREHMAAKRTAPSAGGVALSGKPDPLAIGRDNAATSYAATLRKRNLDTADAVLLMTAFWETFHQPAGDRFELDTALAKLDTAWANLEPAAERNPFESLLGFSRRDLLNAPPIAAEVPGEYPIADWKDVWDNPVEYEWVVDGVIPARQGSVIYSDAGVGKSLLSTELAVAVARGTEFLGRATRKGVVLYVDYENDLRSQVRRTLVDMGLGPGDLDDLRYLSFPELPPLNGAAGALDLLRVALREGATLVIIDTVARTVVGEETSNDTWNAFYRHTGMALKSAGIAFIRLDHEGKDASKGQRGGSAKRGDVDVIWHLEKAEGEFILTCEKDRTPVAEKHIAYRRDLEPLRHTWIPRPSKQDQDLIIQCAIWLALEDLATPANGPTVLTGASPRKEVDEMLAGYGFGRQMRGDGWAARRNAVLAARDAGHVPEHREEHLAAARRMTKIESGGGNLSPLRFVS